MNRDDLDKEISAILKKPSRFDVEPHETYGGMKDLMPLLKVLAQRPLRFGEDCCGKCPYFNETITFQCEGNRPRQKGCSIRKLAIPDPFYTYCSNHPIHNPEGFQVPLGAVYVAEVYPFIRSVWIPRPDPAYVEEELRIWGGGVAESALELMKHDPAQHQPGDDDQA